MLQGDTGHRACHANVAPDARQPRSRLGKHAIRRHAGRTFGRATVYPVASERAKILSPAVRVGDRDYRQEWLTSTRIAIVSISVGDPFRQQQRSVVRLLRFRPLRRDYWQSRVSRARSPRTLEIARPRPWAAARARAGHRRADACCHNRRVCLCLAPASVIAPADGEVVHRPGSPFAIRDVSSLNRVHRRAPPLRDRH
jgi:hypothetical protein